MSFDPNSSDAMFARIMQRLETQEETLTRIEQHVVKTNGRVTMIERWRDVVSAKAAAVSAVVALAAWVIERVFS